jgi:hypothetical protein
MKRLLLTTIALAPLLTLATLVNTTTASATVSAATCTATATGPIEFNNQASTWSLSCSGVNADTITIVVPTPEGELDFYVQSADTFYGPCCSNNTRLPSNFTINQSSTPPTDDSNPSAPLPVAPWHEPTGSEGCTAPCQFVTDDLTSSSGFVDGGITYTLTGFENTNTTYDPTTDLSTLANTTTSTAAPLIVATLLTLISLATILLLLKKAYKRATR